MAKSITARIADQFYALDRALKAAPPQPGALYPMRSGAAGAFPIAFPGWDEWYRHYGGRENARDEARARIAVTSPWIFRGIQAIANETSTSTVVVQRRATNGDEEIENHPFERLWERPNPFMGRSLLMALWVWELILSGEAYLFMRPVGGQLAEIWPVPSWNIAPVPHPQRFISAYRFQADSNAEPRLIDTRYICYSRLPHPFDVRRGLSPLAALWTDIEGDLGMARWNANFFSKENAAPEGLITVPRDTLDEDLYRIRQEIADFFSSGSRRVAVARAGDMDWKAFGRSQKEMEFLEGRGFTARTVDTALGIPEGYFAKDATRANSEGAKATFIENAVWPKLSMLAEDLNAQVMPLWYGQDERATFDDIRPRNRALELQEFTTLSTVLTVNELRQRYDYDPLTDPRGEMLPAEINKGAPIAATPAEETIADAAAAIEAEAAALEAPAEEAPAEGEVVTDDGSMEPAEDVTPDMEALKAVERRAWERKALRKGAAAAFAPIHLDDEEAAQIRERLAAAQDAGAIKAAFKADPVDVEALIDAEWGAALAWARKAMEDAG